VTKTGIHFLECGYIGASPDGLVGNDTIIEVKCPYSLRSLTAPEAISSKNCCLELTRSGEYGLKKSHHYYDQVQGCLTITGRKFCDFVYWTPNWTIIFQITKDDTWYANIELFERFYQEVFLDHVINNKL
jgi:hypothetical protein